MNTAFFSLGSNLGDRLINLKTAVSLIEQKLSTKSEVSAIYETEPWGKSGQPYFLNLVLKITSELVESYSLLKYVRTIEDQMGRKRLEKWGPRLIDIDILFYDSEIVDTEELLLPHPGIPLRMFVLAPMVELAPDFMHPVLLKSMTELYQQCIDPLKVKLLSGVKL